MKNMAGETLNKLAVCELISQGYDLITDGVPKKLDIDLWDYILGLNDDAQVLVLEDLLLWTERQLSLINTAA